MFPFISHIDELRRHVENKPEIRFAPQSDGSTVACYVVSDSRTFDSPWARECRGITFGADGAIICRPLHKFFNIGENTESRPENIPWTNFSGVFDKLDGSMLTPYLVEGALKWKTKKTADSAVARAAAQYAKTQPNVELFSRDIIAEGYTPIFEYTAPDARVVVRYSKPRLTLLHLRQLSTGEYLPLRLADGQLSERAQRVVKHYDIPVVQAYPTETWPVLREGLAKLKNAEGYVLAFGNTMLKTKCPWYVAAHRVVSFIRERDVATYVADERLDDVLAVLHDIGAETLAVEEVASRVKRHILNIESEVEALVSRYTDATSRDIASALETHPLRGLVLACHQGREIDYLTHFKRNHLKEYSLTQLPTGTLTGDCDC